MGRGLGRRGFLAGAALAGAALAAAARTGTAGAAAPPSRTEVDVLLMLLVDASASISKGTLDFQLRGHAAAFRSPAVADAVVRGRLGRVAVQLCQFAGPGTLATLVPWTVLAGAEDCAALAARIDAAPGIAMGGSTALGNAIVDSVRRLEEAPFASARRTVDLVSNGFSNAGLDLPTARGYAAAAGVTVNALAILDEYAWLEGYYAENVVAGEGAFVRTAATRDDFAAAFLDKLVSEIA